MFNKSLIAAAAVCFALPAAAEIIVKDAYARSSAMMAQAGAAFMVIENTGTAADRLIGVASDASAKTEMHTHIADANGVMQMVEVKEGFEIPAGGAHVLERGKDHVMFLGLTAPFEEGKVVNLTLTFETAGEVKVAVPVDLKRGAPKGAMQGNEMKMEGHDHSKMAQ